MKAITCFQWYISQPLFLFVDDWPTKDHSFIIHRCSNACMDIEGRNRWWYLFCGYFSHPQDKIETKLDEEKVGGNLTAQTWGRVNRWEKHNRIFLLLLLFWPKFFFFNKSKREKKIKRDDFFVSTNKHTSVSAVGKFDYILDWKWDSLK